MNRWWRRVNVKSSFYIRWLKERIPALKGIGNPDD
ncbi:hypothetical protein M3Y94_01068200 [Aphelenchoides besseyi]|nr:hypothetical protein M3Y94_01068200 [Aphelenchoides besseyi]